ncbi:hypothetical protein CPE01_11070 [Cellulomonas persica]|uniref:Uncharacterized protein n=1 Tax=Cellulomonas persica TaxID=76861 RepID=A0A510URU2_9CELL|nr:hypothetical protein CPE01_11070 [Cellulomonas persica]
MRIAAAEPSAARRTMALPVGLLEAGGDEDALRRALAARGMTVRLARRRGLLPALLALRRATRAPPYRQVGQARSIR